MPSQAEGVCPECIGFNNFRTRLKVFMVNSPDQLGLGNVQFVIAAVNEDPLAVEQGSHRSVAQDGGLFQPRQYVASHDFENTGWVSLLHPAGSIARKALFITSAKGLGFEALL